jgi:O-Antigen ligase
MGSPGTRRPAGRPTTPGRLPGGARPIRRRGGSLPSEPFAALLPLVLVGAIIAWWGWKAGAYFGVVFLPGFIILLALLAALLLFAPWPARLRGPDRVALFALLGLAGLTLFSALWSPTPDVAISDAQRVLSYAVAFVVGLWLCLLLGRRMLLALAPLAGAGAIVALATLVALWTGSDAAEFFEVDSTLRYPLGYRNAVAAFFLMALWPMLTLAASRDLDWRVRGFLLATSTLSIELAMLAQSRSSVFAVVAGAAVLVAAHPNRLRILGWLALAALPAAFALPWLLDVYQAEGGKTAESIPPLHAACRAMVVTSLLSLGVGFAAARAGRRFELAPVARRRIGSVLLAGLAVLALVGVFAISRSEGGPGGFFERHIDQLSAGTPDLTEEGSRFGFDLRSSRGDFWRVAVDDFADHPIAGTGAGGFRSSFLVERRSSSVQPEDPHSVELLMGSELGLPGLLLFGAFAIGATIAVLRARRLGPAAATLGAGALAVGAYWLMHASAEWFWAYPAITLPMAYAIGAATAPSVLRPAPSGRSRTRLALAGAAVIAAISMVPFFLSERYTDHALDTWQADIDKAYSELEDAADLNPASARPLVTEAVIAESAGDRQRALGALDRAEERTPDEWTLYYLEARILAPVDRAGAERALGEARRLNPLGTEIDEVAAQLGRGP